MLVKLKLFIFLSLTFLLATAAFSQLLDEKPAATQKDSLRGSLTFPRTCYDVKYYHLDVKIDPEHKSIAGTNKILFEVAADTEMIQIDLFENLSIDRIQLDGKKLLFERVYDAVFIHFQTIIFFHPVGCDL
jgi:hypothetical protein